jgi:5'-nucleotidase
LNVNIPNIRREEIKGVAFTRHGKRVYGDSIQETYNPWGEKHYWIGGGKPYWELGQDIDIDAVQQKLVSVTPLHLDMTNYDALIFLRKKWNLSGIMKKIDEKV